MQKEREDSTLWVEMTSFNATAESHNHTRLLLATCSLGLDSAELSNTQQHTNNTGHTPAARESGKIPASHDRSTVLFLNKKLNLPWPPKGSNPKPPVLSKRCSPWTRLHSIRPSQSLSHLQSMICTAGFVWVGDTRAETQSGGAGLEGVSSLDFGDCFMDGGGHVVEVFGGEATHVDAPTWQQVDVFFVDQVVDLLGVQPGEAEHANLLSDVIPGPRGLEGF